MRILVTGGAGYIGSHTVRLLTGAGHEALVYDNLSTGRAAAVGDAELEVADIVDRDALEAVFKRWRFDAVIHFAALISPAESMQKPLDYHRVNVGGTTAVLECCLRHEVGHFIFSSTAAVYGEADVDSFSEDMPTAPINVYGTTKMIGERTLADLASCSAMRHVTFRYYNVAGAEEGLGSPPCSEHLIPNAVRAALDGEALTIFGADYDTPDGTCIRDYIHVADLADLHVVALEHLAQGGESAVLNCGYGHGYSVREVVARTREVSGVDFQVLEGGRREGDPARLIADSGRARKTLNWKARHDNLDEIIESDLRWRRSDEYRALLSS